VSLTKFVDGPKNFTLPKLIDSYSESLSKFEACGPLIYDVRGENSDLVTFDKNAKLLTFDSKKVSMVVSKKVIEVFATLSRYPMVTAFVFRFEYTILESEKMPEEKNTEALTKTKSVAVNSNLTDVDWRTKSPAVNSTLTYVDVRIKSINFFGEVVIGFGNKMKIIDIEALQNATTTKDGITVPALEVRVVPGLDSSPDKLRYIYNITNMTETTMTLKLGFENPIEVGADDIDSLNVTFNDHSYLEGT
jgi:hypothetical protein